MLYQFQSIVRTVSLQHSVAVPRIARLVSYCQSENVFILTFGSLRSVNMCVNELT